MRPGASRASTFSAMGAFWAALEATNKRSTLTGKATAVGLRIFISAEKPPMLGRAQQLRQTRALQIPVIAFTIEIAFTDHCPLLTNGNRELTTGFMPDV